MAKRFRSWITAEMAAWKEAWTFAMHWNYVVHRQQSFSALFGLCLFFSSLILASTLVDSPTQAQVAQCKEIRLEPGQKLESVSWACAPGGYCVPTWLTRPMRPGEPVETHTLHNEKGAYDIYIFEERPAPR